MKPNSIWIGVFLGVLFDAILAAVLTWLSVDKGQDHIFPFGMIFAFLLIAPALFGLWSTAKNWLGFCLFGQERGLRMFLRYYKKSEMPDPSGHFDIDDYLSEVINRKDLDDKPRIAAAIMLGELRATRSQKPYTSGLQATILAERALNKFSDTRLSPEDIEILGTIRTHG